MWMHMQVMQQSLFDSQAHVIQVHKYSTKCYNSSICIVAESKMEVEPNLSLVQDEFSVRY